ncbi:MAG: N5-carboxyaminoimidazole ribonucleotide synthase [Alphaproteobacteria bacterium ADurb.BinA280]|jgi:5-(carboxyamino)imidazole ribonucleotide synthase|nr:5-(carboxyamino)imidazole ribonucleotide synthase [Xanthomonadales bacterium]OPZ11909.1 MAG: N5-carboxyaminoimidazole ribonucleotide synthase [Alphaproteobacteria bacterium ADurb.BinA280]
MSARELVRVGILGGGQLARMLALAGAPLGAKFLMLDTDANACGGQVAALMHADYRDHDALARFANQVDFATFDFENVPADSAHWLAERIPVYPNPRALAVAQDRLAEKTLFQSLGIGTPAFRAVDTLAELRAAVSEIGVPSILKTRRLGYDGKGQYRLRNVEDVDAAWVALSGGRDSASLILESFVRFQRELSVIAVRSRSGEFRHWPLTRNWHHEGVLSLSLAPASVTDTMTAEALNYAKAVADQLDYVGVFALELFEVDGRLLANEMAPRVHNSGHWTIEGAECSQFENHLRAVMGLPLGDTAARGYSAMLNWIGDLPDEQAALAIPGVHWHDYGKSSRPGRKVGHATVCGHDPDQLQSRLQRLGVALDRETQVAPALGVMRSSRIA